MRAREVRALMLKRKPGWYRIINPGRSSVLWWDGTAFRRNAPDGAIVRGVEAESIQRATGWQSVC